MAAKQGLTAHLSQAGEDAKRAVLSRTGVSHSSWFSNLNTVLTIKSAPPKTPEVLQMLSTKSGWLYKRNEQHVWQARWCCIVPHMFLYYFDAQATPGSAPPVPNPTAQQQEEWNRAIQNGYGRNHKHHEKRSNFYLFNSGSAPNVTDNQEDMPAVELFEGGGGGGSGVGGGGNVSASKLNLQPAGIIDLECYSSVRRSQQNPMVLELAGDDTVNRDLRHFYFCANNQSDCEDWTDALLNGRHAALVDECEAYKQVCDGFACQLQQLHSDLDSAHAGLESAQQELYQTRSQEESLRRQCWRMIEDCLERPQKQLQQSRETFRVHLERVRNQDMSVPTAINVLVEYVQAVEDAYSQLQDSKENLEAKVQAATTTDHEKVQQLQSELEALRGEYSAFRHEATSQLETQQSQLQQSQTKLNDVQKELASTKLEFTMYASQQKTKLQQLQEHKRILKKEVIELRGKLEEANSELNACQHQVQSQKTQTLQEKQRADLLERYVEKMESQVKVQQNMMEYMSQCQSQAGSVYGSLAGNMVITKPESSPKNRIPPGNNASHGGSSAHEDDVVAEHLVPIRSHRRNQMYDDDAKSHVSELTEDRTQRHFEAFAMAHHDTPNMASPRQFVRRQLSENSPRGPPSYIIGGNIDDDYNEEGNKNGRLETIQSSAVSLPPVAMGGGSRGFGSMRGQRGHQSSPNDDAPRSSSSVGGVPENTRLSVAQKARMEADRGSTPVKIRLNDEKVQASMKKTPPLHRGSASVNSGLWRRMEEAVLGPRPDDDDDEYESYSDDCSSVNSTRVTDYTEDSGRRRRRRRRSNARSDAGASDMTDEKKTDVSTASATLSLAERSKLQREKQLQFLKEQGLIQNEDDVRGGAGASPGYKNDAGSVTSSNISFNRSSVSLPGSNTKRTPK